MRLYLVHFLFIAGIIAPVVPTRFYISGTVSCQSSPPWCYTIQLLELDSNFNDVITSVSGCELTNPNQKFSFEGWQPWDGLFDIRNVKTMQTYKMLNPTSEHVSKLAYSISSFYSDHNK
ncbi:Protein CBG27908 [Caenorhabditis briggsae]|uniref:Protein CBG27908 n=1 Tax=Caenorhabditis briggsae TaxID=6238 RepID=B6IEK3_CAEBR|nr:Protein CBG27908 [Caenorhabditis briggsae]CAR98333.1 Protein CBG27908 [Caenorhabditis briggsae]